MREVLGNSLFPVKATGDFGKLFRFINSVLKPGNQYIVVNAPRNVFKSTNLCSLCVFLICLDRNIRILYATNTYGNAQKYTSWVCAQLESNPVLIEAFGTFKPERTKESTRLAKWSESEFYVSGRTRLMKEPTLSAAGLDVTKTGMHYDVIIVDDAVDFENTKTRYSIDQTKNWFRLLMSLADENSRYGPGGVVIDAGTRYDDADLHGWLLGETDDQETPADDFRGIVLKAMNDPVWDDERREFVGGTLNFPEILDWKKLNKLRRILGPTAFYMQYQNECIPPERATFLRRYFKLIPYYEVPPGLRYYVLTDYAYMAGEDNDYTALWVVGLDWRRMAYCVDLYVGRPGFRGNIDLTVSLISKYDCEAVTVEKTTSNEGTIAELKRALSERRVRCRIIEIGGRSTESKGLRIQSLQARFDEGDIMFAMRDEVGHRGIEHKYMHLDGDKPVGPTIDLFLRWPRAVRDDPPDALSDIDKMDRKTMTYFLAGASARQVPPQQLTARPVIVNGRFEYLPATPQPEQQAGDFWTSARRRLQQQRGRLTGDRLLGR